MQNAACEEKRSTNNAASDLDPKGNNNEGVLCIRTLVPVIRT